MSVRRLPPLLLPLLALRAVACAPAVDPPPPAAPPAPSTEPAPVLSDRPPPAASSAPAASASASASGATPQRPPWTDPIPGAVPPALAETFRKLASVGKVTVEGTSKDGHLVCEDCGPERIRLTASSPAEDGSYSATGRPEAAVVVEGDCGVRGRVWGCTVLLERREDGGWRWKSAAPLVLQEPRKLRLAGGRELLVGRFRGSQMGGTWEQIFSLDFSREDPIESVLVMASMDVCSSGMMHLGAGSIDAIRLEDRDRDGVADLVVSLRHGERPLPRGWQGCKERPDGVQSPGVPYPPKPPVTLVFLRGKEGFSPDPPSKKWLSRRRTIGWPELHQE